jgi:hypothetical protein
MTPADNLTEIEEDLLKVEENVVIFFEKKETK